MLSYYFNFGNNELHKILLCLSTSGSVIFIYFLHLKGINYKSSNESFDVLPHVKSFCAHVLKLENCLNSLWPNCLTHFD